MEKTKPTWKYAPPSVATIEIDGKVYNASPVGRGNFHQLREANYGEGFRQGIFREQLTLVHSAYINQEKPEANKVTQATRQLWITGNTAIIYTPELVIAQDNPIVENGRIIMPKEDLISKLSNNVNKGVRFSEHGDIRSLEYGFGTQWQSTEQMRNNSFPILLTGDLEAPEKLAEIQEEIGKNGYIHALDKGSNNEIRVPDLGEGDGGLGLWVGFGGAGYSFGVRQ